MMARCWDCLFEGKILGIVKRVPTYDDFDAIREINHHWRSQQYHSQRSRGRGGATSLLQPVQRESASHLASRTDQKKKLLLIARMAPHCFSSSSNDFLIPSRGMSFTHPVLIWMTRFTGGFSLRNSLDHVVPTRTTKNSSSS
ncbi:hypothetical protein Droror1_Dr00001294 [Drosera rotundifolia]